MAHFERSRTLLERGLTDFSLAIVIFARQQRAKMMDSKKKYESPSLTTVELKYEGVLCQSGGSDPLIPEII